MNEEKREIDWAKIKAEYVSTAASLRELGEKYDVSLSALQKRSAKGNWKAAREKFKEKKAQEIAEGVKDADVKETVKGINRCVSAAGRLIDKVNKAIEELDKDVYIAESDVKTVESDFTDDEGNSGSRVNKKVKIKKKRYKTLIDAKKLEAVTRSLVNIKELLTEISGTQTDESESGIIEIPQMAEMKPPEVEE